VNIIRKAPKIIAIANPAVIKSSVLLSIFTKQIILFWESVNSQGILTNKGCKGWGKRLGV
jgi:hypothetical protein